MSNPPGDVRSKRRTRGLRSRKTSSSHLGATDEPALCARERRIGVSLIDIGTTSHDRRIHQEPVTVEAGDGARERVPGKARLPESVAQEPRDPDPRSSRPKDHDALVFQGDAGRARAGNDPRHRRRPLGVVVEAGEDLAVPVEEPEGVRLLEVLPLEESPREAVLDGMDELVHERVVFLAAQTRMAPAQVQVVLEERLVVRSHIEADGQRLCRVDAGRGYVEGELADGDPHAPRPLVAEAQCFRR
jgi:hypothetical protein